MKTFLSLITFVATLALSFVSANVIANLAGIPELTYPLFAAGVVLSMVMPAGLLLDTVITPADLTFNAEEIRSLSEAIFERVFVKPAKTLFHTIQTGIETDKQIVFMGRLGLLGRKQTKVGGACVPATSSEKIVNTEKFWRPKNVEDRLVQCWEEILDTFFVYTQNKGIARPDITSTDFAMFVQDRMTDAVEEAVYRIAWFNDVDSADVNASPAGTLTAGTDTSFFNIIDGMWKQIFAIVTADPDRRYTIPENALGTYALQDALAANRALLVVRNLKQKADARLKGSPDKLIIWTDSLNDNLETFLESQNVNSSFDKIERGHDEVLRYNNIPIHVFEFWDRTIREFFDNGTTWHLPHRAVMSVKENLVIGAETESALSEIDVFYDKKDKEAIFDILFRMDAKVLEDYMVQVAY